MDLYQYLWECRKNNPKFRDSQFADKICISKGTLSRIKTKTFRPSVELAMLIEKETKGKVLVSEMLIPLITKRKNNRKRIDHG